MDNKPWTGSDKLCRWMDSGGPSAQEVAAATKKSKAAVYAWRGGEYRPDAEARALLDRFSGGEVPEDSWLTDDEREARQAVKPFAPHRDAAPHGGA